MQAYNWQTDINNPAQMVEGAQDIAQSVYLILTTIKGSDPLRPDFGSDLYQYIDRPLSECRPRMVFAILEALERWETRMRVTKCTVTAADVGKVNIHIEAETIPTGEQLTINVNI